MKNVIFFLLVVWSCLQAGQARALQLSPLDFASLGSLATTGDLVLNSDTLQATGAATFTGLFDAASQAAVFTFDDVRTANLSIVGSHPLALLSLGNISFDGPVTSSLTRDFEIAAIGAITVNDILSTGSGSNLSIVADTIQISNGARIASVGGSISVAMNVQLFTGNIGLGGGTITGLTLSPGAGSIVAIGGVPAPVPLPGALLLFGSGLASVVGLILRKGSMAA